MSKVLRHVSTSWSGCDALHYRSSWHSKYSPIYNNFSFEYDACHSQVDASATLVTKLLPLHLCRIRPLVEFTRNRRTPNYHRRMLWDSQSRVLMQHQESQPLIPRLKLTYYRPYQDLRCDGMLRVWVIWEFSATMHVKYIYAHCNSVHIFYIYSSK